MWSRRHLQTWNDFLFLSKEHIKTAAEPLQEQGKNTARIFEYFQLYLTAKDKSKHEQSAQTF